MSAIELWVMFTLGLASSLHCVQMRGPIVLSYSLGTGNRGRADTAGTVRYLALGHVAYNAGRIITYTALGALAGLAGGTLGMLGRLAGASSVAALVGGGLMIIAGLFMLGIIPPAALAGVWLFACYLRIPPGCRRAALQPGGRKAVSSEPCTGVPPLRADLRSPVAVVRDGCASVGSGLHAGIRPGHRRGINGTRAFLFFAKMEIEPLGQPFGGSQCDPDGNCPALERIDPRTADGWDACSAHMPLKNGRW